VQEQALPHLDRRRSPWRRPPAERMQTGFCLRPAVLTVRPKAFIPNPYSLNP